MISYNRFIQTKQGPLRHQGRRGLPAGPAPHHRRLRAAGPARKQETS